MVYAQPSIIKAGTESDKLIQHGWALFVMWNTGMMCTGTAMLSTADKIFSTMLMTAIGPKIKMQLIIVIYVL